MKTNDTAMMESKSRIFRIIKETRGKESRYFPQYKSKTQFLSFSWFYHLVEGNDWQYWIGTPTFVGEYTSFIPVKFKTNKEALAFVERQRVYDNGEHAVVA